MDKQPNAFIALKAELTRRCPISRLLLTPLLILGGLFLFEFCVELRYSDAIHTQQQPLQNNDDNPFSFSTKKDSGPLWARLGFQTCRFPDFYDLQRPEYNLYESGWIDSGWTRREELKAMSYQQQEVLPPTDSYLQILLRKEQPRFGFSNLTIARNISFVHIGKAGGSSLGCNLAEPRRYVRKHCSNAVLQMPVPMSALALSVNCYTHWNGHMYCYNINQSFLANVRNPIKRLESWFLYEHVRNHQVNYLDRDYHCGDLILFSCYESFDELVSIGLQPPEPSKNQQLRVGPNLTAMECSHWAWAAVKGSIPASYHNFYNYDWYTHHMYSSSDTTTTRTPEIFAIRAEHFEQDWRTIDTMLGGTGSFPDSLESKSNEAEKKPLLVTEKSASSDGIRNLCRALCEEIQIYKKLLTDAVNLNDADRQASLKELREVCPDVSQECPGMG